MLLKCAKRRRVRIRPVESRIQALLRLAIAANRSNRLDPILGRPLAALPDPAARRKIERALVRRDDRSGWRSERRRRDDFDARERVVRCA